jgi:hypothetical protein
MTMLPIYTASIIPHTSRICQYTQLAFPLDDYVPGLTCLPESFYQSMLSCTSTLHSSEGNGLTI